MHPASAPFQCFERYVIKICRFIDEAASVTFRHRTLQLLTIEIYKSKLDLNPKFMGEIFVERSISYSLRGSNHLSILIPSTNACGLKAIRYSAHKLWQSLPLEIKESHTLKEFKKKIEKHQFGNCSFRLCNCM